PPVLVVIAQRDFDFDEYRNTVRGLGAGGCSVVVAAKETLPAIGHNDSLVKPDIALDQVESSEYSGVVVIGGIGSVLLWDDSLFHQILLRFANSGHQVVAGIGLAPVALAKAGVLQGRRTAALLDAKAKRALEQAGARFVFRGLAVDGFFITANGPKAGWALGRRVASMISRENLGRK
ncbi:MAG: DJ-1/PfpI family protein, partial [candidate division WOR-3 bacterium]